MIKSKERDKNLEEEEFSHPDAKYLGKPITHIRASFDYEDYDCCIDFHKGEDMQKLKDICDYLYNSYSRKIDVTNFNCLLYNFWQMSGILCDILPRLFNKKDYTEYCHMALYFIYKLRQDIPCVYLNLMIEENSLLSTDKELIGIDSDRTPDLFYSNLPLDGDIKWDEIKISMVEANVGTNINRLIQEKMENGEPKYTREAKMYEKLGAKASINIMSLDYRNPNADSLWIVYLKVCEDLGIKPEINKSTDCVNFVKEYLDNCNQNFDKLNTFYGIFHNQGTSYTDDLKRRVTRLAKDIKKFDKKYQIPQPDNARFLLNSLKLKDIEKLIDRLDYLSQTIAHAKKSKKKGNWVDKDKNVCIKLDLYNYKWIFVKGRDLYKKVSYKDSNGKLLRKGLLRRVKYSEFCKRLEKIDIQWMLTECANVYINSNDFIFLEHLNEEATFSKISKSKFIEFESKEYYHGINDHEKSDYLRKGFFMHELFLSMAETTEMFSELPNFDLEKDNEKNSQ